MTPATPAHRLPSPVIMAQMRWPAAPGGKATELGARLNGEGLASGKRYRNSRAEGAVKESGTDGNPQYLCDQQEPGEAGEGAAEFLTRFWWMRRVPGKEC